MIGFLCKVDTRTLWTDQSQKSNSSHLRGRPPHSLPQIFAFERRGIKLRLTIWEGLADSFLAKVKDIDERTIVILATSLLPKSFGGKLCINASSSTKIYLNADFEDVKDFRARHKLKTVIKMVKATSMIHVCIVFPKYYTSFPTKKSRFRLEVEVEDESDTATFVIFYKDAKQMMKTTAAALMTEKDQDAVKDDHDRAPVSILNIVGKMYQFLVKVTPYNFRVKYQSFTVSRIVEDISKFDTEETHQKKSLVSKKAETSNSPATTKIKIEDKEVGKEGKGIVKPRKL
ncbi:hypothetical protein ACS0TY_033812 [Phlomoides rotata]